MGVPYVFGGTAPNGFDCSGFVQYIYKQTAGISLPRTTDQQYNVGTSVCLKLLRQVSVIRTLM